MSIKHIDDSLWQRFFDDLSQAISDSPVEIDVGSIDLGAQTLAHNIVLQGISYDANHAQIELLSPELSHRIEKPRDIYVEAALNEISNINITSDANVTHIILFKQPLTVSNNYWGQA